MERPPRRMHFSNPLNSVYNAGFDNQHGYYNSQDGGLNIYDEPKERGEYDEPVYDPDQDLQRKRARVDFKLKSTFEAIFEKYGRDFEGIGDEIDQITGKIVVNNGHILEMRYEMDAGDARDRQRQWSEELDNCISGSDEEDDVEDGEQDEDQEEGEGEETESSEDEEDYDVEGALSDEEVVEDDLILRGFAQASQQFMDRQQLEDAVPSWNRFPAHVEQRDRELSRLSLPGNMLPSRKEILAQFGSQLGPEIIKYVSKRVGFEDSQVEPAWRIPDIVPTAAPVPTKRPLIKSMVISPESETERSPSPENAQSIWTIATPKSSRKRFWADEDDLLLDFITDARRRGLNLSKQTTWKQLEAMNPRHNWMAWKKRYKCKFTYLHSGRLNKSEVSTSETSSSTAQALNQHLGFRSSFEKPVPPRSSGPTDVQRPVRLRKPAKRDGIVSWSEAVDTIASVDPVGNAGLLEDFHRASNYSSSYERPNFVSSSAFPTHDYSFDRLSSKQPAEQPHGHPSEARILHNSPDENENEVALSRQAFHNHRTSIEKAPCPHADCRLYSNTLYGLERVHNEEMTPMCSHLLHVHRIAPFSCEELDCNRKGAQGYSLQKDLVRHVKDVHPYATALCRLRGRVDPALLTSNSDLLHQSIGLRHGLVSGKQTKDSDFMSPQRPYSSHGPSYKRFSVHSDENPGKSLTSRAVGRAVSEGTLSTHAYPSRPTVNEMTPRINFRERSSDSDPKVLDEIPCLDSETSKIEPIGFSDVRTESSVTKTTAPSTEKKHNHSYSKAPCIYSNCQRMISIHNMAAHLKVHEKHSRLSIAPKESLLNSKSPLPISIPNSQSSVGSMHSNASSELRINGQNVQQSIKPTAVIESFIDRSYEFSDDEDGIRPVIRTSPQELPCKPTSVPQSFFHPPIEATSSQPTLPPKALPKKRPQQATQSFTTPAAKKLRKSTLGNALDSEDFDELSLAEDGFLLLSARPRSGTLPKSTPPIRVKHEELENETELAMSKNRRTFAALEDDDEVDELAEDCSSISTPDRRGPTPASKSQARKVPDNSAISNTSSTLKPKPKKRPSNGIEANAQSSSRAGPTPHQTPPKQPQLPSKKSTPLINIAESGPRKEKKSNEQVEIPSTSELGSSPNSLRARTQRQREATGASSPLTTLQTPRKKTWAGRNVKQEDEDGSVVTPGGTLRRCEQDGFACGRAFCFKCRAVDDHTTS